MKSIIVDFVLNKIQWTRKPMHTKWLHWFKSVSSDANNTLLKLMFVIVCLLTHLNTDKGYSISVDYLCTLLALSTKARIFLFRFIIEYRSLMDFGP
jgi:hypothetical protein